MVVDGKFYPKYPYIRNEDIGQNTSNMFVNSAQVCNLFLEGLNGDYDGDTITVKPIYTVEANEEAEKTMQANYNFINMGATPNRKPGNEAYQAMYNMTLVLSDAAGKTSYPVFGKAK